MLKRNSIMIQKILNSDDRTILREVRNIFLRTIIFILAGCLFLFFFTYQFGFGPAHNASYFSLRGMEIVFICISIVFELLAVFWFKITGWEKRSNKTAIDLWSAESIPIILTIMSPVCGYILRITGSGWHVIFPLFFISILALIIIFPTKKKIARWKIVVSDNTNS